MYVCVSVLVTETGLNLRSRIKSFLSLYNVKIMQWKQEIFQIISTAFSSKVKKVGIRNVFISLCKHYTQTTIYSGFPTSTFGTTASES